MMMGYCFVVRGFYNILKILKKHGNIVKTIFLIKLSTKQLGTLFWASFAYFWK